MARTVYHNVHGLDRSDEPGNVTNAWDLSILARQLIACPEALEISSTVQTAIRGGSSDPHDESPADPLSGVDGLKTGYTGAPATAWSPPPSATGCGSSPSASAPRSTGRRFSESAELIDKAFNAMGAGSRRRRRDRISAQDLDRPRRARGLRAAGRGLGRSHLLVQYGPDPGYPGRGRVPAEHASARRRRLDAGTRPGDARRQRRRRMRGRRAGGGLAARACSTAAGPLPEALAGIARHGCPSGGTQHRPGSAPRDPRGARSGCARFPPGLSPEVDAVRANAARDPREGQLDPRDPLRGLCADQPRSASHDRAAGVARDEVDAARRSNETIIFGLGHASVAEHAVFNLDILGVSRLAIEEIERMRLCSYTEKSQRYILLDEDFVVPEEIVDAGLGDAFRDLLRRAERLLSVRRTSGCFRGSSRRTRSWPHRRRTTGCSKGSPRRTPATASPWRRPFSSARRSMRATSRR